MLKNTFKIILTIFLVISPMLFVSTCSVLQPKATGRCVYGPPGAKACITGTYKSECENDYNGTWTEGADCN